MVLLLSKSAYLTQCIDAAWQVESRWRLIFETPDLALLHVATLADAALLLTTKRECLPKLQANWIFLNFVHLLQVLT